MYRPYIVCHMVTSVDGKVTGQFLESPHCEAATDIYFDLHRRYKEQGAGGFICGRVTMESSFTGGWYPDYLLEGGSIINGHFLRADCVDELSLVQAPVTADADAKPLFMNGDACGFELVSAEQNGDVLVTNYKREMLEISVDEKEK